MTSMNFLNPEAFTGGLVLAVDIGGTKIAAAVVTAQGEILAQLTQPTPQAGPVDGIRQIITQLEGLIGQSGIEVKRFCGIGIGIPAVLEPGTDFVIWAPNLKDWTNVDLRGALEAHFGLPVCLEYDGHTAVLGEWWMGAGRGYRSLVSVIIGTGVGGGMVLDGHLIRGLNRLAGAVGWFAIDQSASAANPESRSLGSWEALTAGPGIARRVKKLCDGTGPDERAKSHLTVESTAKEVFSLAKQGDPLALQLVHEEADLLGLGLSNIVSLVNPEIIILGGSVGTNAEFLIPRIKETVERNAQPISGKSVEIVSSKLGTEAGLLGAAYGALLRKHILFS
jgi:glucokinase